MSCVAVKLISILLTEARAKTQSMMKHGVNKIGLRLAVFAILGQGKHSSKALKKNFLDDLSNSGPAVRLYGEGRATGPPKTKNKNRYRRKEKSCHSIWLLTTFPTTSTLPL